MKTLDSDFFYIYIYMEVWFAGQNFNLLEMADKIDHNLVIN